MRNKRKTQDNIPSRENTETDPKILGNTPAEEKDLTVCPASATAKEKIEDGSAAKDSENDAAENSVQNESTERDISIAGNNAAAAEKASASAGTSAPSAEGEESSASENGLEEAKLKKQSRRNKIGFLISLLIIGCVVYALWTLSNTLSQGDTATFREVVAGMNWWYIVLAFGLFFVMFVMEALKFTLLCRCNQCSLGFAKDMKLALIGKYYECITPFSSGGQPMQIYYLHKNGVPSAKGASIAMVKYGVHMLGFTVVAALVMGFGVPWLGKLIDNQATLNVIIICGWIGFGINAFIPVFVTLVVFLPKPAAWLINLCVKILHKIRIIRHPEKWEAKVRKWFDDFSVFSQFVYKKPLAFLALFLLCLGEPVIELIFPYLVLVGMLGGNVAGMQGGELFFAVVVLAMYATYAATFIPTPGNSGAIEMIFLAAFATMTESVLFWFVLFWRFIIYYTWIVLGLGMNVTDLARRVHARRQEARASGARRK